MTKMNWRLLGVLGFVLSLALIGPSPAAEEAGDDMVPTIVGLIQEKDREIRALGMQQVREGVKGAAATKQFVAILPKLSPEVQAELVIALGERGDKSARTAVVELLKSPEAPVRAAVLRALGTLGEAADVPRLAQALAAGSEAEKAAAGRTLDRMRGEGIDAAIIAALKPAKPELRVELIELLVSREAAVAVPALLAAAEETDADVRAAALAALSKLAGPAQVPALVKMLLKAEGPADREALEKVVMFACQKAEDPEKRAEPLLAVMAKADEDEKIELLSALGRVGGATALKVVEAVIADKEAFRREVGIHALCNWPDASVAPRLMELAQKAEEPAQRIRALRAVMRVAVLADKRTPAQRLELLKKAFSLATRDEDRKLAIDRARAVRTIESLRFVVPFLDDPKFAQAACVTVVELAHYRDLRTPNKEEFDKALDAVIATSKNAEIVTRAKRYQKGETH